MAWPAQLCALVPQSFNPALTMPMHFSLRDSSAASTAAACSGSGAAESAPAFGAVSSAGDQHAAIAATINDCSVYVLTERFMINTPGSANKILQGRVWPLTTMASAGEIVPRCRARMEIIIDTRHFRDRGPGFRHFAVTAYTSHPRECIVYFRRSRRCSIGLEYRCDVVPLNATEQPW